jgi:hypothetical protein
VNNEKKDTLAPLIAFLFKIGKRDRQLTPLQQHRILERIRCILVGNESGKS